MSRGERGPAAVKPLAPFPWGLAVLVGTATATAAGFLLLVRWMEPELRAYEYGIEAYWLLLLVALLAIAQWVWAGVHVSHFWRWALLERSRRRARPGTACWDHPWDPDGVALGLRGAVWAGFAGWTKGMLACYPVFVWVAIVLARLARLQGWPVPGWVLVWLVGVVPVVWLSLRIFRASGGGRQAVRYPSFPLGADGLVTVRFETDPGGPAYERLSLGLLCRRGRGTYAWDLPDDLGAGLHFERECELNRGEGAPDAGGAVEVTFELPADAPSTSFTSEAGHRYELWVDAETTAGKWTRRMLLPVYPEITPR